MSVTKFYLIGGVTVPTSWVAFIIGVVVAYFMIRIRFGKQRAEQFSDTAILIVLVWKLSVILTDFSTIIRHPLSLLYFHGGTIGFYVGVIVAFGYILFQWKRKQRTFLDATAYFYGFLVAQSIYQLLMALLNDGYLLVRMVSILVSVAMLFLAWWKLRSDQYILVIQMLLIFGCIHIFLAAVQSIEQANNVSFMTTIFFALSMSVIIWNERKKQSLEEANEQKSS